MTRAKRRVAVAVVLCLMTGGCLAMLEGFLRLQDEARRASCRPHLVLWTCRQYAADNEGQFPSLSPTPGKLVYDVAECGDYCFAVSDCICEFDREGPSEGSLSETRDPSVIDDWSYVYLGYYIENEAQGMAFAEKYRETVAAGGTFEEDLLVGNGLGNCGGNALYRLRDPETLPEELKPLAVNAARIPVVVEWPGNHREMGGHVVFLDGHTEYRLYPGDFPMTKRFIEALRGLDALGVANPPSKDQQTL